MRRVLLTILILSACGKNDKPPPPTSGSPNAKPETGPGTTHPSGGGGGSPDEQAAAMFQNVCSQCHGMGGLGDGPAAASLNPKPRNYTDAAWQSSVTDDDIKKIIVEGGQAVGKSGMMPAQVQLKGKPEVVDALVKIIRGFGAKKMITTSLDGLWATVRRGREVMLLERGAAPAVGQLTLESDDVDVALVGTPSVLLVVSREPEAKVTLHQPPYLDAAARVDLGGPMKLAAVTGPRAVLVSPDGKRVLIVRTAQRALAAVPLELGAPVELAVGLDRNQVLFALPRKLEVWDAVSSRPLLRLQLQLPPPPRTVGAAQGHLWATRPGSDEVFVYRLSDGRPFRHHVGAPIEEVICHPASPLLVLVTPRGLVRLHCLAHSLTVIDSPWTPGTPLAQIGAADDISLLGIGPEDPGPWRVPIAGAGAAIAPTGPATAAVEPAPVAVAPPAPASPQPPAMVAAPRAKAWRDPLAAFGLEIARGLDPETPIVALDTELGELAHRLHLQPPARRALSTLYALYLVGEPGVSIARLAHVLGDWTEPLGQGDLNALAMLRKKDGKVALRSSVTELLDGVSPRAIRLTGGAPQAPRPGATRVLREGRSDAAIETDLATQLGRIAVIEGAAAPGLLEARMYGATAVALAAPYARPQPWPREAALVVVADGGPPPWVAALPPLT